MVKTLRVVALSLLITGLMTGCVKEKLDILTNQVFNNSKASQENESITWGAERKDSLLIDPTNFQKEDPYHEMDKGPYNHEMITIPAGNYLMGSKFGNNKNNQPLHKVTINAFRLGQYEVTQKQWRDVMGWSSNKYKRCDDCPVDLVSWEDVQDFIYRLNQKTWGKPYRLPSESEWEYACRSGGEVQTYCGGDSPDNLGWYNQNSSGKTHPVGRKKPNRLGLYDMTGNVSEYVEDCYFDSYVGAPTNGAARTNNFCSNKVARGGSFRSGRPPLGSTFRGVRSPTNRNSDVGFRLAQDH